MTFLYVERNNVIRFDRMSTHMNLLLDNRQTVQYILKSHLAYSLSVMNGNGDDSFKGG